MGFLAVVIVGMLVASASTAEGNAVAHRHMVPVRERQDASLCRYDVVVDHDPLRIPDRLDKVLCRRNGCKCVEAGDFRCTQLYTQLNVSYIFRSGLEAVQFDTLDVEQACVCARTSGQAGVQELVPDLV